MIKHQIEDTVRKFKYICNFRVTLPCAQHLWDVNYEAECLDDVKADLFHSLKDKLLYITKSKGTHIEQAVEFLTTKVANINVDDWNKLRRCISYLNQMVDDIRIIGFFNITELFTYVDASYAVHPKRCIQK